MKNDGFSWNKRLRSFRYAFEGIVTLVKDEHNSRIHIFAMVCVIIAGVLLHVSAAEWCVIVLCFGCVLTSEAMNSGIEALSDLVSPEYHPLVKKAKDVAAAGVLMMAMAAAAAGLIIFLPKIIFLFRG